MRYSQFFDRLKGTVMPSISLHLDSKSPKASEVFSISGNTNRSIFCAAGSFRIRIENACSQHLLFHQISIALYQEMWYN